MITDFTWMSYQLGVNPHHVKPEPTAIVMYPYDYRGVHKPVDAHYCNLYDEKDSGKYGPYLKKTQTGQQYNESRPDPAHPGFMKNITDQLDYILNFKFVEWDNLDAYHDADVIRAYDESLRRGINVYCKNPVDAPLRTALVMHPAIVGIIQEVDLDNDYSPEQYVSHAATIRKEGMPVHFVVNNMPKTAAKVKAAIIKQNIPLMSVSLGGHEEYEMSEEILSFLEKAKP